MGDQRSSTHAVRFKRLFRRTSQASNRTLVSPLSQLPLLPNLRHPSISLSLQRSIDQEGLRSMAQSKTAMRKPIFTKVDQLQPETNGHNLTVKVISSNMVLQKVRPDGAQARPAQIAECLVGDETGTIVFTARNGQVDLMMPDTTVILRNAKIDMFKGSMRLAVDKWGRIEVTEPASFDIKEDNNLSLVEYELVNAVEQ
ncbi:hypothetical protein Nepgr_016209 [Nepenthes gracilis]|uniref:Single-stranded DNA binding protein Ssb-like OB fold domain-containing protein n=1 Tax=Nepenthes gracilis TaxID=150966 RepID=A0AAD3XRE4_NEPGR|nr:hypothetical protein Nepgr_016209 [Nepenthes gracilis]